MAWYTNLYAYDYFLVVCWSSVAGTGLWMGVYWLLCRFTPLPKPVNPFKLLPNAVSSHQVGPGLISTPDANCALKP